MCDWPRRMTKSRIHLKKEEVLRESLFLVGLFNRFTENKIKLKLTEYLISEFQLPEKWYQSYYSWKDNKLDLGPFELVFEPKFIDSLKIRYVNDHNIEVQKKGIGSRITLSEDTTLPIHSLISLLCPENQGEFQKLRQYARRNQLSLRLSSFLGK